MTSPDFRWQEIIEIVEIVLSSIIMYFHVESDQSSHSRFLHFKSTLPSIEIDLENNNTHFIHLSEMVTFVKYFKNLCTHKPHNIIKYQPNVYVLFYLLWTNGFNSQQYQHHITTSQNAQNTSHHNSHIYCILHTTYKFYTNFQSTTSLILSFEK